MAALGGGDRPDCEGGKEKGEKTALFLFARRRGDSEREREERVSESCISMGL